MKFKFGNSVADIFIIKHTQFGQDAFGFDISIVHCLRLVFSWTQCTYSILSSFLKKNWVSQFTIITQSIFL